MLIKKSKNHKTGFTLIELLVVIAIIGLLATISVVALSNARARARDSRRVSDIKQIHTALELYYNAANQYPETLTPGGTLKHNETKFLDPIPTAPTPPDGDCQTENNSYVYERLNESDYTLEYCLGNSTDGLAAGPSYASPIHLQVGGGGAVPFVCGVNTVTFDYNGSTPSGTSVTYGTVEGANGTCWLDRNLGASQVCDSSTDAACYGDLFQWGRVDDGHQIRTSSTVAGPVDTDTPGHNNFITNFSSPNDWREGQNDDLWQEVNGINNPCPPGWRIPTETELNNERLSWSPVNSSGAFASPLKWSVAGYRNDSNGSLYNVGSNGRVWGSTVSSTNSRYLRLNSSGASMLNNYRAYGYSVRCLRD